VPISFQPASIFSALMARGHHWVVIISPTSSQTVSVTAPVRKARASARLVRARWTHPASGWIHAPRPGRVAVGSRWIAPSGERTIRTRAVLCARVPHPMQVRCGPVVGSGGRGYDTIP